MTNHPNRSHAAHQDRRANDLVSMAQIIVRLRFGNHPPAAGIEGAGHDIARLADATEAERLAMTLELYRRYGL